MHQEIDPGWLQLLFDIAKTIGKAMPRRKKGGKGPSVSAPSSPQQSVCISCAPLRDGASSAERGSAPHVIQNQMVIDKVEHAMLIGPELLDAGGFVGTGDGMVSLQEEGDDRSLPVVPSRGWRPASDRSPSALIEGYEGEVALKRIGTKGDSNDASKY